MVQSQSLSLQIDSHFAKITAPHPDTDRATCIITLNM